MVTADLDNIYPGVEALLEYVDYAITSREFPARLTGNSRTCSKHCRKFRADSDAESQARR